MEKINNNYQLSKTLRFELKPIGKTLELMIIDKIKRSDDLKKIDLKISNKEWLHFAQNKPYLNE